MTCEEIEELLERNKREREEFMRLCGDQVRMAAIRATWTAGDVCFYTEDDHGYPLVRATPYPPIDPNAPTPQTATNPYGVNPYATYRAPASVPAPAAAPVAAAINPAHAHEARKNRGNGMYTVTGPGGYFKEYHHEDEAEAIAAFWSGDMVKAAEFRKRRLIARGLIQEEV